MGADGLDEAPLVAGIDGCRGGWVVVTARLPAGLLPGMVGAGGPAAGDLRAAVVGDPVAGAGDSALVGAGDPAAGDLRAAVVGDPVAGAGDSALVGAGDPAAADLREGGLAAEFVTELGSVVAAVRSGRVAAAAVDMPIGLLHDRPRACDRAARRVLGPRRSTVFPAPMRPALAASTYSEACDLSRAASGRALPLQTFHLLPAIRHLDELLTPDDQERFVEAHPECAFARLAGGPEQPEPLPSKHEPEGRQQRRELLTATLGPPLERLLAEKVAPVTDLLDAAVLTITARHLLAGTTVHLGDEADVDSTGKRAEVVY